MANPAPTLSDWTTNRGGDQIVAVASRAIAVSDENPNAAASVSIEVNGITRTPASAVAASGGLTFVISGITPPIGFGDIVTIGVQANTLAAVDNATAVQAVSAATVINAVPAPRTAPTLRAGVLISVVGDTNVLVTTDGTDPKRRGRPYSSPIAPNGRNSLTVRAVRLGSPGPVSLSVAGDGVRLKLNGIVISGRTVRLASAADSLTVTPATI